MKYLSKLAFVGAVAVAFAPFASAVPLPITQGGSVTTGAALPAAGPGSVTPANGPVVQGAKVYDSGYLTVVAPTFTATYEESVFHDSNNTICAGCLTFAFQIGDVAGSSTAIEHLTAGSFSGFLTDVGYVSGTGSGNQSPVASPTDSEPVSVDESQGGTISFNFTSVLFPTVGLQPGNVSDIFFIETNAENVTAGNGGIIDSSTVNIFPDVPAGVTPEPSSLVMLGTGLLGVAGLLTRRRRLV